MGSEEHTGYGDIERLRGDPNTWSMEQELEVVAEVYDPRRPDIHELADEELLDRFRSLLGVDLTFREDPALREEKGPGEPS